MFGKKLKSSDGVCKVLTKREIENVFKSTR